MADTVGCYDAKTHLPQLLKRVAKGERITITRHGTPVAVLVPPPSADKPDVKAAIARLRAIRKNRQSPGLSAQEIREMIEEGRR